MSYQVANSKIILAISNFFNISKECSIYIYYRFKRSLRQPNDKKYLFYSIQFQNALVRADKTLGIDWLTLDFANELCTLEKNGIDIEEQDNKVFRWGVIDIDVVDVNANLTVEEVTEPTQQVKVKSKKTKKPLDKKQRKPLVKPIKKKIISPIDDIFEIELE